MVIFHCYAIFSLPEGNQGCLDSLNSLDFRIPSLSFFDCILPSLFHCGFIRAAMEDDGLNESQVQWRWFCVGFRNCEETNLGQQAGKQTGKTRKMYGKSDVFSIQGTASTARQPRKACQWLAWVCSHKIHCLRTPNVGPPSPAETP